MSHPMRPEDEAPARLRWARLRFSIIGPLLASPPEPGELAGRIDELASKSWKHPTTGEAIRFSAKTIERMYYAARERGGPAPRARAQGAQARGHASERLGGARGGARRSQYREHPRWSYQLHHDNLAVLVKEDPSLGPMAGYATVCRFMKDHGLSRASARRRRRGKGGEARGGAARDALVRGRARQRALALRLPRGQAAGAHRLRGAEDALSVRHPRRLLARVLPRAVVPRTRRTPRTSSTASARGSRSAGLPRAHAQRQRRAR